LQSNKRLIFGLMNPNIIDNLPLISFARSYGMLTQNCLWLLTCMVVWLQNSQLTLVIWIFQ